MNAITAANFATLYREYRPIIEQHLWFLVRDRDVAADLTQDTFVKAWRSLSKGTVVAEGAMRSWLKRIARNTAIDWMRHRHIIEWVALAPCPDDSIGDDGEWQIEVQGLASDAPFVDAICDRIAINAILVQLRPEERLYLLLPQQFPVEECARHLGIRKSTFLLRVARARQHFVAYWRSAGLPDRRQQTIPLKAAAA